MTTVATNLEALRYPVGRFTAPDAVTPADRERWIADIAGLPAQLRAAVEGMSEAQLASSYRPGGWTVRQVVHHIPDSHLNAVVRVKLALTEDAPTIKPYDESRWAELPDVRQTPIAVSLALLDALHARWVVLLRALEPRDWARTYVHPEHPRPMTLDAATAMYSWHSRHHLGHVRIVADRAV
jgi:hypothetical protein